MSIAQFQTWLRDQGYPAGASDGIRGKNTTEAAFAYAWDRFMEQAPTVQRTSPRGVAALASHEGFVPAPYFDSVGVLTVYIGHTAAAGAPVPAAMPRGMPADLDAALDEGFRVFARDLAKYEDAVRAAIRVPVEQHEFDAAVSFHYNTGAIAQATWVKSLNRGDRSTAAEQIMNWRSPAEIIPRRQAEQRLFRDGTYPDKPTVVWKVDAAGKVIWKPVRTLSPEEVVARLG